MRHRPPLSIRQVLRGQSINCREVGDYELNAAVTEDHVGAASYFTLTVGGSLERSVTIATLQPATPISARLETSFL